MQVVDWSPEDLKASTALVSSMRMNETVDPTLVEKDRPGFLETAAATWRRENFTVDALASLGNRVLDKGNFGEADPSWNPYSHIKMNWSVEDQDAMSDAINMGLFDGARTADHVEALKARISEEKDRVATVESGSGLGALVGGFAAAFTDLTTFIPFAGIGLKARTAGRLGKIADGAMRGATIGIAGAALQEAGLQQTQDFRSAKESWMNIGMAGVIGGGLGGFARAIIPDHPLNPRHPDNPLNVDHPDARSVAARTIDGEDVIYPSSVGAAQVEKTQVNFEKGLTDNKVANALGITKLAEKITGATPVGRTMMRMGENTRTTLSKMMDMGGVLTDTARFGERIGPSAEDIKLDMLTLREGLFVRGENILLKLNQNLGTPDIKTRFGLEGEVSRAQFLDITRKHLLESDGKKLWSDTDNAALIEKFGEDRANLITSHATQWAEEIHKVNAEFERKLVEMGKIRDEAKVKKLKSDLDALRFERDNFVESPVSPDGQGMGRKARTLDDIRTEIETVKSRLDGEMSKAKSLGRDYGHAQLWDSRNILTKQEEFEDFLYDILAKKPDEEWLLNQHGMTNEEWSLLGKEDIKLEDGTVITAEAGAEKQKEIMRDWVGDEYVYRLKRAELNNEAAQQTLKEALQDLKDTMIAHGFLTKEVAKLTVQEARKFRDRWHADLEYRRAEAEVQKQFLRTFKQASEAARQRTLERDMQFTDVLPDVGMSELAGWQKALDDLADAEKRLTNFHQKKPGESEIRHGVDKTHRVLPVHDTDKMIELGDLIFKRQQGKDTAWAKATEEGITAPKAPELDPSAKLAMLEERGKQYADHLDQLDATLAKRMERIQAMDAAHEKVAQRLDVAEKAKAGVADALNDFRTAHKSAAKDARQALRELRKVQKESPLEDTVSDLMRTLTTQQQIPFQMMDRVASETGRVKDRRILLNMEERMKAEELGFLRTDLNVILHHQYEQLSGWIGLHEGLGIGEGKRFGSWSDVVRSVEDEYNGMLRDLSDPKEHARINADKEGALKDLALLKDRILGTTSPGVDRDGWVGWMSRKARQANVIRYGAGFLIPSLTDVASVALQHGSIAKMLMNHGGEVAKMLKDAWASGKIPESELYLMALSNELGSHGVALGRMEALGGMDQYDHLIGIGTPGTTRHTVTSRVDASMNWLTDKVGMVSGLRTWNRFWKIASGVQRAHTLRDWTAMYDKLPEHQVAHLASLGIGRQEADRLNHFITKYGSETDGKWDPNLDQWITEPQGRAAARDFRIAVQRDMRRSIMSPGIGDTPGLMSHEAGKLWLQFQTFAFTFMNRFMMPTSQRLAAFGAKDGYVLAAMGNLLWSSMAVMSIKDLMNGKDPRERFTEEQWGNTTKELIDRSGLLTYMSPYIDSALKASGGTQEALFGRVVVGPTSKFQRNEWADSMLGANFRLMRDIQETGAGAFEGDADKFRKKGMLLLPANTVWRMMNQIGDD